MFAIEKDSSILVIDAGLSFPSEEMLGIDLVLPDFTYLAERADQVVGIVSVCSHLIGPQIAQVIEHYNAGDTDAAKKVFDENVDFMKVIMGLTASPIPVKYATGLLGLDVGDPRLPNVPPTDQEAKTIRGAMEKLGIL